MHFIEIPPPPKCPALEVENIVLPFGLLARIFSSVVPGFIKKEDRVSVNSEINFILTRLTARGTP